MLKCHSRTRLYIVFLFFVVSLFFLTCRLAYLQAFRRDFFTSFAARQHNFLTEILPKRGIILDANNRPMATNIELESLYADARGITNKAEVANKLSSILNINRDFILERIRRDKGFIWIARKIAPDKAGKIRALNIKGLGFIKEPKRCYPHGEMASHIIGFAGMDNNGLEGMELLYDPFLKGTPGWRLGLKDAKQRELAHAQLRELPAVDGCQIVLTIDDIIQSIAERELEKAYKKYNAKGASIVVMDPRNGDILAMATRPTYNLNRPASAMESSKRNRAITDVFEPGSVFKIVTAAAALEEGVVRLNDKFYCENGICNFGGHILHDHTPHGTLTFRQVITNSSNIGTVKVAMKVGAKKLHNYIELFGFGKTTGLGFPGEVRGILRPLSRWSGYSISSIPIGQEIAATPMQLACAMAAIANGGLLVKPRLVKEIRDSKGVLIKSFDPEVRWRAISKQTSDTLKGVLGGVVEEGTGKAADIGEYKSGGKTGTAQKTEPNGQYSHSRFVGTFAGFAPLDDPNLVVVVSIDEPRPVYYGGVVAAPVFKAVAQQVLRYLGVQPDGILASKKK